MKFNDLLKKAWEDHLEFQENWSGCETQIINNDPKTFDDLWNAHKDMGVLGQLLFSIARTEHLMTELIRLNYKQMLFAYEKMSALSKVLFYCKRYFSRNRKCYKIPENPYFGADIDLNEKIDLVLSIGKDKKRNSYKNMTHLLADYRKFRNLFAHSELTFCNTRQKRLFLYWARNQNKTYHINLEEYVNAVKENLQRIFPILVDWFSSEFWDFMEAR
jgi:hypothetical protein